MMPDARDDTALNACFESPFDRPGDHLADDAADGVDMDLTVRLAPPGELVEREGDLDLVPELPLELVEHLRAHDHVLRDWIHASPENTALFLAEPLQALAQLDVPPELTESLLAHADTDTTAWPAGVRLVSLRLE